MRVLKRRRRNIFVFGLLVSSALLLLGTLKFLGFIDKSASPSSIRSHLVIPPETCFLNRPDLLAQIEERLKGKNDIKSIVLVGITGIGGVGKTTIARRFGRLYKASVVWEINAETRATLVASFKDLAYELAKTDEQKKRLNFIQNIGDFNEREKQLLTFVGQTLKGGLDWLLIYDNVEDFSALKAYLPNDPQIWGYGKVVITTRDANMSHAGYSQSEVISIEELTKQECLTLFSKILYKKKPSQLTSTQREEALNFLKNIPPFPLDVSVVAYYIRSNNLSYQQYLERISRFNQNLENAQQELLKEISDYKKTRYGIITSSLAKIIESNQEFQELLLFIGLLDSQNIPTSLLESYKSPALVAGFIHELKKYSLITAAPAPSSSPFYAFSIHRSTHAIILSYLTKVFNLEKNQKLTQQMSISFGSYIDTIIQKEDFSEMKFLLSHCETFLSHSKLVPNNATLLIKGYLGCIFCYLRDIAKAKKFLEESLEPLSQSDLRSPAQICQIPIYLGNIYMEEGDYPKAKEYLDKALLLYKDYLSKSQGDVARSLTLMGDTYLNIGEHHKARSILEKSLMVYEKSHQDPVGLARVLGFMGNVYIYLGEYEKAKQNLEQSILLYKKHFPKSSVVFAYAFVFLGNAYAGLGDYEKAKSFLEQGVKIYKENFLETHVDTALAMLYLADVYINLKNYKQAEEITKKSLEVHEKLFEKTNIRTAEVFLRLGNVYRGLKDYQKAGDILKQTLIIYGQTFGKDHILTAQILKDLGLVYLQKGQLETAEAYLDKALKIFTNNKHPDSYTCLESLAELYLKKHTQEPDKGHHKTQAIDYLNQALAIVKEHFPKDSPHAARIKSKTLSAQSSP